jgi:hypothetical protein
MQEKTHSVEVPCEKAEEKPKEGDEVWMYPGFQIHEDKRPEQGSTSISELTVTHPCP